MIIYDFTNNSLKDAGGKGGGRGPKNISPVIYDYSGQTDPLFKIFLALNSVSAGMRQLYIKHYYVNQTH